MRAVILAGGCGTRLSPYTAVIPKPLLPVGRTPILELVIRHLAAHGFTRATLALGYMSTYFKAFLQNNPAITSLLEIDCIEETQPLGTAGAVKPIVGLDETFLVMNGDVLTDLDLGTVLAWHRQQQAALTIAAIHHPVRLDFGILKTDADGRVIDYIEKPTLQHLVSMGIYIYEPSVLNRIGVNEKIDFPDLVLRLIREGQKVSTFVTQSLWLDLGRHEDLQQANALFGESSDQASQPGT
ncbi:MAG: NTP transferase domain-containing protein [Planctomycetes bacterium]|nr:NTP transferase domain-containing protein [Planctomycetota bacterium]